jgi:hypothetical protein
MTDNRRPLETRSAGWAKWLASVLVKSNISPNQISLISILPACQAHGYKVNQTHEVSLRGGGLGHWLAGQMI